MSKSTARRKGVYVSNAKKSDMSSEGQSSHVRAKRNVKMSNAGDMDEEDEDEDESMDDDYCFNVETDTSGDEDESTDEDEEGDEEYPISTHPFDTIFKNRGWSEDEEDNENGEDEEDNENGEDGEEDKNGEKHVTNGLCGFDKQYLDKVYKNGQMYCPQRWGEITLRPFLMFMSKADFMLVLSDFCIQQGISLIVIKSDKVRYTGQCSGEKCTWKLHCSRLPDRMTWAIKTISGDHIECFFERQNPMATTQWMAKKLEIELRAQPNMPVKCMKKYFMDHYGLEVALRTMYKVRIAVTKLVTGGHEQSYNYLGAYCEMIKKTNPGSYALITWNSPNNDNAIHFKGLFVSYNAWIRGFLKGCRPIIGVDGCHLKGRFKGVLLSAISLDGNNKIFCVAYAIVGKETTDSWTYFFRNLRIAFQQHQCIKWDWTFISDRMKGVDKAIEREFPLATRRVCAQHLYTNFKDKWSGPAYYELFWRAAKATSSVEYAKAMESINKMSLEAYDYLSKITNQWSMHQFNHDVSCTHNTSNFVESFNSLVSELREKPVLELIEGIRTYFMDKIAGRMELAYSLEPNDITPYVKKELDFNCYQSRQCKVIRAGCGEYEVEEGASAFPVNILTGTCLCGEWQVSGVPCKHACRAIYHNKEEPMHYVNAFFLGHCYKLTYEEHMHPIPDKDNWPTFNFPLVLPPIQERGIGRPKKDRIRKPDEPRKSKRSTTLTCSICKGLGHNSRGCQGGPTAKEKKAKAAAKAAAAAAAKATAAAAAKATAAAATKKKRGSDGAAKKTKGSDGAAPSKAASSKKRGQEEAGPSTALNKKKKGNKSNEAGPSGDK